MHSPAALLGATRVLLAVAGATSPVPAALTSDLAMLRIRVAGRVTLSGVRPKARAHGDPRSSSG